MSNKNRKKSQTKRKTQRKNSGKNRNNKNKKLINELFNPLTKTTLILVIFIILLYLFFFLRTPLESLEIEGIKSDFRVDAQFYDSETQEQVFVKKTGTYDIILKPKKSDFSLEFKNTDAETMESLKLSEIPKEIQKTEGYEKGIVIDPSEVNFEKAELKTKADGNKLYKCAEWNFENEVCDGLWINVGELNEDEEYSYELSKEDPAFIEMKVEKSFKNPKIVDKNQNEIFGNFKYYKEGKSVSKKQAEDFVSYDFETTFNSGKIKKIYVSEWENIDENILYVDKSPDENIQNKDLEWLSFYVVNPENTSMDYAELTLEAQGEELYKCANWNFNQEKCNGEWIKIKDLSPGEDYDILVEEGDPAYGEVYAQVCNAEERAAQDSFGAACDGTYPNPCGSGLDLLTCDDNLAEAEATANNQYSGVKITSYNSSVTDCGSIDSVLLCYEWWQTGGATTCSISVDNDNDNTWASVSTTCPGTAGNPGVTCTNVTSLEAWNCSNFFGATGIRATAKMEITRGGGAPGTLYHDVLYFDVNYTIDDNTNPVINNVNATPNPVDYNQTLNITANVTDNLEVHTVLVDINGTNYTLVQDGTSDIYYYDDFDVFSLYAGLHNYTVYANDTFSNNAIPVTSNFTINAFVNISLTKFPLNFTDVEAGQVSQAITNEGWPLTINNAGNTYVNITLLGENLTGQTFTEDIINVEQIYWSNTTDFSINSSLTKAGEILISNMGKNTSYGVYFKLLTPINIRSQTYQGNVTFAAVQS